MSARGESRTAAAGAIHAPGEATSSTFRWAAMRAAERIGGGVALAFARSGPSGTELRLRSAAGFASAEDARRAAARVHAITGDVAWSGASHAEPAPAELGGAPGMHLVTVPIRSADRVLGVLCVAGPRTGAELLDSLQAIGEHAAVRVEREEQVEEVARLRARIAELESRHSAAPEDEILALSETVFARDLEILRNRETIGKIERLKNDFIEKMSRELRTPLNSIIESIITVLANDNESLSDGAKDALRTALDEGTAFLRTLQNILDLWRLRQREMPLELHDVSFRDVVDESIFSVQDTLGDKPVTIEKHLVEPLPKIRTDLSKLSQILFLVLDNAAKFTTKGRIDIRASVRDGTLFCDVEDTGIGICPDDQQLVFDEFFQVDASATSRYRGAGLGLTLVRELLTLLGGTLSLGSEVGRGTCFRFELPVQVVS